MQISDREIQMVESAPSEPTDGSLVVALRGLFRAFQRLAMYPSGHPSVPEAVESATTQFLEALAGRDRVNLCISRDEILFEDETISEGSDPLRSLAVLLHELDMAVLEVRPGLSTQDLESLVHLLAQARRDSIHGEALVDAFERRKIASIRLHAIDYGALRFGEGVAQPNDDVVDGNAWTSLTRVLCDPAAFADDGPVERLAQEVTAQLRALEGTGVSGLRTELHRQLQDTESMDVDRRELVRRRMGNFVSALHPDLRRNLLQVGANRATESLSLVTELAESIPTPELLEALRNVDRVGGQTHGELVTLLNKLVRISRDRPPVQSAIEETLERWGVSSTALNDPGRLGEAVEEVLQRRGDDEFNPEQYRQLLGGLGGQDLDGRIHPSAELYLDPTDADALKLHCVEIAVQLLGRPDGDESRAALFGYVGANVEHVLERFALAPITDAVVAAKSDRVLEGEDEQIRRAGVGFLDDFKTNRRIRMLLDRLRQDPTEATGVVALLEPGGAPALDAVLDFLDDDSHPALEVPLRRFCSERGTDVWEEVIERRAVAGWAALRPVLPLVRELPPDVGLPLARRLLEHPEPRVRQDALSAACELDPEHCVERYVVRALTDGSVPVVSTAVRHLAMRRSPTSLAMLGSFVGGSSTTQTAPLDARELAVTLLLDAGEPGCMQLSRALGSLRAELNPGKVRRGRWLVERLAAISDPSESVREAIRSWNRSPAKILSHFVPRLRSKVEERKR